MIKLFETGTKLNFIDDRNAFVGFDFEQDCCEDFGWLVLVDGKGDVYAQGDSHGSTGELEMKDWAFDKDTPPCEDLTGIMPDIDLDLYEGGAVAFRIRHEYHYDEKGWLVLYNSHNGYYFHGWEFGYLNVEKEGRL